MRLLVAALCLTGVALTLGIFIYALAFSRPKTPSRYVAPKRPDGGLEPMRYILIWTEADLEGLQKTTGLERLLTEFDEKGTVTREIGFDADGNIVHRHPGVPTREKYGIFDLASIAPSTPADVGLEEFERLWST